ncbi:MAG: S8 family serine peptidase [Fimbriimonadia bacterium]|jgi:thermitase
MFWLVYGVSILAAQAVLGPPPTHPQPRIAPDRVVVELSRPVTLGEFRAMCEGVGDGLYSIPALNTHVLRLAPGLDPTRTAERLRRLPWVRDAGPDYLLELAHVPNDPLFGSQWDKTMVGAEAAWDITKGSSDTIIAILDTGVMLDHEDLIGQFVPGWNVQDQNTNVYDDFWHGTRVTGVAAAIMDNNKGIAGMAPQCRYMPVKILKNGSGTVLDMAAGLTWAADNGARVCNISSVSPSGHPTLLNAVRYCVSNGVVVVAAAGNSNNTSKYYPAGYPEVISVAASNVNDTRGWNSTYGSWVMVAAPGQDLLSTGLNTPPGDYKNSTGTSYAAPLVAAEAGMIYGLLAQPGERAEWLGLAVRDIIQANVVPKDWVKYGRVNVAAALQNVFVDVSGRVTLDAWIPGPEGVVLTLQLREQGTQTVVEETAITLDDQGNYSARFRRSGEYDLVLVGGGWLNEGHASVVLPRGQSQFDFVTRNGDVDRSNMIDLLDINMLLQAWGLSGSRPEDVNGDGEVSLPDLSVVLINFARSGF